MNEKIKLINNTGQINVVSGNGQINSVVQEIIIKDSDKDNEDSRTDKKS